MQTLEMHLGRLVSDGLVTRDDAVARSLYPNEIGLDGASTNGSARLARAR
jgi:hypothetical protein